MEDINMCDCCKDIWNRENLIKFDFTNNHKLFICPDCLEDMTNGDIIKAIYPNCEIEEMGDTVFIERYDPYCKCQFNIKWWNAPYERS